MSEFYTIVLAVLAILAVSGLYVGVTNDAVNFLNAAIGSKVAKMRTILMVASVGIIIGVLTSSGDQWYAFYHRPPRGFGFARQPMVAPVTIQWDETPVAEGGQVVIRGYDPYAEDGIWDAKASNGAPLPRLLYPGYGRILNTLKAIYFVCDVVCRSYCWGDILVRCRVSVHTL